jgi:hypothetical protein
MPGDSISLACGLCSAVLTPYTVPWLPVWYGGFFSWLLLLRRYEPRPPEGSRVSVWLGTALFLFFVGAILSVDLWTLFLVFWTARVLARVVKLRHASLAAFQALAENSSPIPIPPANPGPVLPSLGVESENREAVQNKVASLDRSALFHKRILQFLAGGLAVKTVLILLDIEIITL